MYLIFPLLLPSHDIGGTLVVGRLYWTDGLLAGFLNMGFPKGGSIVRAYQGHESSTSHKNKGTRWLS